MSEDIRSIGETEASIPAEWPSASSHLPHCPWLESINTLRIGRSAECLPTVQLPYPFQSHNPGNSFFFHFFLNDSPYLDSMVSFQTCCPVGLVQLFRYQSHWKEGNSPWSQGLTCQFFVSNGEWWLFLTSAGMDLLLISKKQTASMCRPLCSQCNGLRV